MSLTLIETKTLGTAAASIEFTSIPQDGTDLVALASLRESTTSDAVIYMRFNSDTGSNYSRRFLAGNGSTVSSNSETTTFFEMVGQPSSATSNTFGSGLLYVANYTSAVGKSLSADSVGENNATLARQRIVAGLWTGTDAITSVSFFPASGNWAIGSTVSLYKVTKGSDGIVTTS